MKVAFVLGEFPVIAETFVLRQISGMVEAGHEVCIVTARVTEGEITHEKYQSLGLRRLVHPLRGDAQGFMAQLGQFAGFLARAPWSARGWRALAAAARAGLSGGYSAMLDIAAQWPRGSIGRFDAIVAHFGTLGVRAMYLREAGLIEGPLATVFHGFDMSLKQVVRRNLPNYRRLFTHAEQLLPISELWKRQLLAWGAPAAKLRLLRMGVDLDRLPMLAPARALQSPLRVLSVARFTEKKGLAYAVAGVLAARTDIVHTLIGGGPLEGELRALAAGGPPGRFVFAGKQPQHRVFEALAQADVFLLPSVTAANGDMEGVPVVLMEAMAQGVLVLSTRHSGIPELVEDGVSGLLVDERDPAAIAQALERIARGEVDVAQMRQQARRAIEARFDNATLERELFDICRNMALRPRPSEAPPVIARTREEP